MKFPLSLLMMFIACCLIYVAVHGTDATTPSGIMAQLIRAFRGEPGGGGSGPDTESTDTGDTSGSTGREESAAVGDGGDDNGDGL